MQFKNILAVLALATSAVTASAVEGRDYHNHQKPVAVIEFECIEFIAICPANAQPFCCNNGYGDNNCVPWCEYLPCALLFDYSETSYLYLNVATDSSSRYRRHMRQVEGFLLLRR